jgi:alkaline phosphatase D
MPIREVRGGGIHLYRTFHFGGLVDLVMLDTRSLRDRQVSNRDAEALANPDRTLLGAVQEAWLFDQLRESQRAGTRWTLLGQQVVFSTISLPGMPVTDADAWDGYPAQRARVLDFVDREQMRNLVVLTGDAHSSWGFDVPRSPWSGYRPASGEGSLAVELVTPAISSPPPTMFTSANGSNAAAAIRVAFPHLKCLDGVHRGYLIVDVTAALLSASWYFTPDVRVQSYEEIAGPTLVCERGSQHLQNGV